MKMFTKADLEQIRNAAIAYWQQSDHEFKNTFIQELEQGAIFIKDADTEAGKMSIGSWILEEKEGEIILKRPTAYNPEAIMIADFILHIVKKGEDWIATKNSQEISW